MSKYEYDEPYIKNPHQNSGESTITYLWVPSHWDKQGPEYPEALCYYV